MLLTLNNRTQPFAPPEKRSQRTLPASCDLSTQILRQDPPLRSCVLLQYVAGDENIYWPTLLWQLVTLRAGRPDLRLVLKTPITSPLWLRLLAALDVASGDDEEVDDALLRQVRQLTPMESRILLTLLSGAHVRPIADKLRRDTRTISSHKRRAMEKVGLANNGELYALGALLYGKQSHHQQDELSHSEQRVLTCLLGNGSVTTTARLLHKSVKTVSTQKRTIMKKLGVAHEVALYALRATE